MTTCVLDQHEDDDWKDLPEWVREAAKILGYTKKLWNKDREPPECSKDWKELSDSQREAAQKLGYTQKLWDDDDDESSSSSDNDLVKVEITSILVLDQHEEDDWKDLPEWVRREAESLGYTKKLWNKDREPDTMELDWKDLTQVQQESARRLGYTPQTWDKEDGETGSQGTAAGILVLDKHGESGWNELPEWVRDAAESLGYTETMWNDGVEPAICTIPWKNLSLSQQEAATKLGYTEVSWDMEILNIGADELVLDKYEESSWGELPEWVQTAARVLGYTAKHWNRDKEPQICQLDWEYLTSAQQDAAKSLGYTQETWDDDEHDDAEETSSEPSASKKARTSVTTPRKLPSLRLEDVHPHTKWTIYCIQLYTETEDYQFRMKENMGLSMYSNRPLKAEEFIIQSPVGPCVHEGLFEPPTDGTLTNVRREFAERFLQWHQTYGPTHRTGAQNAQLCYKLEDFSNPSITDTSYRDLPRPDSLVYEMEIFEHETVLIEFVPPPSRPDYELPPDRRFEILNYDEGLAGIFGEEGYDPAKMKRPPTLCGLERRELEVPGHFSNHVSGQSSTAFDFVRISDQVPIPNNLPEWIQKELESKRRIEGLGAEALLMARRDLEVGTEITTDYSRWHWANADLCYHSPSRQTPMGFFLGDKSRGIQRWNWKDLSPKIQRAARILGYTEALWEDVVWKPAVMEKPWMELTLQEQEAARNLMGLTHERWNSTHGIMDCKDDDESSEDSIMDLDWSQLSEEQKKAAQIVGFTEDSWEEVDIEELLGEDLYFFNYRPEIRDALVALGKTEATWENDDNYDGEYGDSEPWFECLCGSHDCHSSKEKGGFRGVKYFPLELQRQVVPLCEGWVQQQFLWKLYQLEQQQKKQETTAGGYAEESNL